MSDITEPNFDKWVDVILDSHDITSGFLYNSIKSSILVSIKQAYEQGKSLGYREGYDHGMNMGWVDVQDNDKAWRDSFNDNLPESRWETTKESQKD